MIFSIRPELAERLELEAQKRQITAVRLIEIIIEERLPLLPSEAETAPAISAKNAATIAYLDQRIKEEATDDPDEIRKADE